MHQAPAPDKPQDVKGAADQAQKKVKDAVETAKKSLNPVTRLFEKFIKDAGKLNTMQRIKRIGEILFVAAVTRFKPENKKAVNTDKTTAETGRDSKPETKKKDTENEASPEKANESVGRHIARIARGYINVVRDEFRTPDVKGGVLACAKVATTILKKAGITDAILLSVSAAHDKLKKQGWKEVEKPPQPGDVIIWAPTGGYLRDDQGASVAQGHRHIGIALSAERCVSNSSSKKLPVEHQIFTRRPVEKILRAPDKLAA